MITIIEDGFKLPTIKHSITGWSLEHITEVSSLITYVDLDDVVKLKIKKKRTAKTYTSAASAWCDDESSTFKNYVKMFKELGSNPIMSLNHVIWIVDHKTQILNTEEKNSKGDYIGNFFFIKKDEDSAIKQSNNTVACSVIKRNITTNNQKINFGLRFYSIDDPKIWSAEKRVLFSLW